MRTCQALEARMRINTWHSAMAAQTFQQEYMQMPPITRAYTTACVLTTIAVVSIFFIWGLLVFLIHLFFFKL